MPPVSTLLSLLALVGALVYVSVLPRIRLNTDRRFWMVSAFTALPALLLLAAFLSDVAGRRVLVVVGAVVVGVTFVVALVGANLLRTLGCALSPGGLLALVTGVGTLMAFGAFLQVRIDHQRNPLGGPLDGVSAVSFVEYSVSSLFPALVLVVGLIVVWVRLLLDITEAPAVLVLRRSRRRTGLHRPRWLEWLTALTPSARLSFLLLPVLLGFALPLFQPGSAKLTFLGVAVSEWLRPVAFLLLAGIMARQQSDMLPGRKRWGYWLIVLGFTALLGLVSVLRNDFGTMIPYSLGLAAMGGTLAYRSRAVVLGQAGDPDSPTLSPLASDAGRLKAGFAILLASVLVLAATFLGVPYMKGRLEPYQDPWQFAWTVQDLSTMTGRAACQPSPEVPPWMAPGVDPATKVPYTSAVPTGYSLCYETLKDVRAANQSQVARSLTAVDGGGLWGRGLSDSEAGIVPVIESDFVLAAVWSKFGGIVTVLLTLLTVTVWATMTGKVSRMPWRLHPHAPGNWALLYASGMGAALAGQAVYVLAATVNLVFHSGVPFPFVARGGQAMGGLTLGLVLLVALVARTPAPDAHVSRPAAPRRRSSLLRRVRAGAIRSAGLLAATLVAVLALVVGTAIPFASRQRLDDLDIGLHNPGVQRAFANRGLPTTASLSGMVALVQDRATGAWSVPYGVTEQLPVHDLYGVLRVDKGGAPGIADALAAPLLAVPVVRTLADRLSVSTVGQRSVALTIDPDFQLTAAKAARAPLPEGDRLPAGVVVLDPSDGAILALTTAPDELDPLAEVASEDEVLAWRARSIGDGNRVNTSFGELLPGGVLKSPAESDCASLDTVCARYNLVLDPPDDAHEDYLRTYTGDGDAYSLPRADVNRAVGRGYNLGSTFKVVIAAAYLENGGQVTDHIPSPSSVTIGSRVIQGPCAGTQNGRITVGDALRVSCNPAFIQLARDLGWSKVAATAGRLGFTLTGPGLPAPEDGSWPTPSLLPARADSVTVGNLALGGGDVSGTPLQMAALMGAIANGGIYHEPYLIAASMSEDGTTTHAVPSSEQAISAATARNLQQGLAEVTGEGGTLAKVETPEGVRFYGKSGTQVLGEPKAFGNYTSRYNWVVGVASRDGGDNPIAFAVVVEGHDATDGHDQVRAITAAILQEYGRK